MMTRELSVDEANEYLLGLFRALLTYPKFKAFIDEYYVIRQYYDEDSGKMLRVEITDKEESNEDFDASKDRVH